METFLMAISVIIGFLSFWFQAIWPIIVSLGICYVAIYILNIIGGLFFNVNCGPFRSCFTYLKYGEPLPLTFASIKQWLGTWGTWQKPTPEENQELLAREIQI